MIHHQTIFPFPCIIKSGYDTWAAFFSFSVYHEIGLWYIDEPVFLFPCIIKSGYDTWTAFFPFSMYHEIRLWYMGSLFSLFHVSWNQAMIHHQTIFLFPYIIGTSSGRISMIQLSSKNGRILFFILLNSEKTL